MVAFFASRLCDLHVPFSSHFRPEDSTTFPEYQGHPHTQDTRSQVPMSLYIANGSTLSNTQTSLPQAKDITAYPPSDLALRSHAGPGLMALVVPFVPLQKFFSFPLQVPIALKSITVTKVLYPQGV
jgi:hypothetical protein